MGVAIFGNGFPELKLPLVVSTVRFSKVIEASGKPDIHLLLIDPAKDKTLQAAIKSDRVMTLYQQSGSTDHGIVGFEQGRSRQFLVFPKSLKPFNGQRIVGIKYELLEDAPVPEKETAKKEPVKPVEEAGPKPAPARKTSEPSKQADRQVPTVVPKAATAKQKDPAGKESEDQESTKAAPEDNVVKFQKPEPAEPPAAERDDIKELKQRVREAMDALEAGKQVVAFNLLKSILDQ
jgi:hypothetical protein